MPPKSPLPASARSPRLHLRQAASRATAVRTYVETCAAAGSPPGSRYAALCEFYRPSPPRQPAPAAAHQWLLDLAVAAADEAAWEQQVVPGLLADESQRTSIGASLTAGRQQPGISEPAFSRVATLLLHGVEICHAAADAHNAVVFVNMLNTYRLEPDAAAAAAAETRREEEDQTMSRLPAVRASSVWADISFWGSALAAMVELEEGRAFTQAGLSKTASAVVNIRFGALAAAGQLMREFGRPGPETRVFIEANAGDVDPAMVAMLLQSLDPAGAGPAAGTAAAAAAAAAAGGGGGG
eukprot:SAG22_NODE_4884_length_1141_cov_2.318618_1_plen_296_part_10